MYRVRWERGIAIPTCITIRTYVRHAPAVIHAGIANYQFIWSRWRKNYSYFLRIDKQVNGQEKCIFYIYLYRHHTRCFTGKCHHILWIHNTLLYWDSVISIFVCLQQISIVNNVIHNMSIDAFYGLNNLKGLRIERCLLRHMPPIAHVKDTLLSLFVPGNLIAYISDGYFEDFRDLTVLSIAKN